MAKMAMPHLEVARASCPCDFMAKACPELAEGMAMPHQWTTDGG
jgi:hypothetical protein